VFELLSQAWIGPLNSERSDEDVDDDDDEDAAGGDVLEDVQPEMFLLIVQVPLHYNHHQT